MPGEYSRQGERSDASEPLTPVVHAEDIDGYGASGAVHKDDALDTASVPKKERTLGSFGILVVSFAAIAGGPYGIEAAVGAGGALPTLIGLAGSAVCWSATQALVTAELSTMMPSNAGYIAWVVRGLGPVAGFVNAWNMILSASLNIPLYPVLFASYIQQLVPSISDGGLWAIKLAGLAITVILNTIGVEAVEIASLIMVLLVQTPFIMMPVAAAVAGQPFDWSALARSGPWTGQFAVFMSTICWNMQGWANMGNIASEVKNPSRSYPVGLGMAVIAVALNYLYPVTIGVAQAPDYTQWQTGYFVTIAQNTSGWLGYWALVAAALSSMANLVPWMTIATRAVKEAAVYRIIPVPLLAREDIGPWRTPVPAILLQAGVVAVLMSFSFDVLVVIQILFANIGLLLQFLAFLRLKYTQPDAHRPYAVPYGKVGAWCVVMPFVALLCMVFYSSATGTGTNVEMGIVAGVNAGLVIGGWLWARYGYDEAEVLADLQHAVLAGAASSAGGGDADGGGGDAVMVRGSINTVSSSDNSRGRSHRDSIDSAHDHRDDHSTNDTRGLLSNKPLSVGRSFKFIAAAPAAGDVRISAAIAS